MSEATNGNAVQAPQRLRKSSVDASKPQTESSPSKSAGKDPRASPISVSPVPQPMTTQHRRSVASSAASSRSQLPGGTASSSAPHASILSLSYHQTPQEVIGEAFELFELPAPRTGLMYCTDLSIAFRVLGTEITRDQVFAFTTTHSEDGKHFTRSEFTELVLGHWQDIKDKKAESDEQASVSSGFKSQVRSSPSFVSFGGRKTDRDAREHVFLDLQTAFDALDTSRSSVVTAKQLYREIQRLNKLMSSIPEVGEIEAQQFFENDSEIESLIRDLGLENMSLSKEEFTRLMDPCESIL